MDSYGNFKFICTGGSKKDNWNKNPRLNRKPERKQSNGKEGKIVEGKIQESVIKETKNNTKNMQDHILLYDTGNTVAAAPKHSNIINRPQFYEETENMDTKYPFGVSVCISAWRTQDYIEECLDSVANQTWFKNHDNWEILLGIDGCEETLTKVKEIMDKYKNLRVMMMDHNVGTYVTCNTIMKEAKYEWLLRFDSDDVMTKNMVATLMNYKEKCNDSILRYKYINFTGNYQKQFKSNECARGSILFNKNIFDYYGGYQNWQCAADFEMIERLKKLVSFHEINEFLFFRRKHNLNLTKRENTGMNSEYRKSLHKKIFNAETKEEGRIACTITGFQNITQRKTVSFIIVNRGGENLDKVIENINKTFPDEKEIIIVNQEDNDFFKRGQLFNIGSMYANGDYLVLMDNDIIILHPFSIIEKYNEFKKPYLPFTKVSQLTFNGKEFLITRTESRPYGFGAFSVVSKTMFKKVNGFSNLCMNWGGEDNIFNLRVNGFYRIDDNIGHITHPKRSTSITEKHRAINTEVLKLHEERKINAQKDGLLQTKYTEVYHKKINNVFYVGVKDITVTDNYIYKTILNKHYE